MTDRLKERLRDVLLDWDGSTMPDGAETRVTLSCGEIRDTLDRITQLEAEVERTQIEAAALFRAFCRGLELRNVGPWTAENTDDALAGFRAALHQGDRKP